MEKLSIRKIQNDFQESYLFAEKIVIVPNKDQKGRISSISVIAEMGVSKTDILTKIGRFEIDKVQSEKNNLLRLIYDDYVKTQKERSKGHFRTLDDLF